MLIEMKQQGVSLCYQPKFNLHNQRLSGTNVSAQWHNRGFPTVDIIQSLIEAACRQNKKWHESGIYVGPVTVNINELELCDPHFSEKVIKTLISTDLPFCLLELEVPESVLFNQQAKCVTQLKLLNQVGISIAIYQFGIGKTSFEYLNSSFIDSIKIHSNLIQRIKRYDRRLGILSSMLGICRDLHINTVVEGISNPHQFGLLHDLYVDEVQGDLLSPAMSADAIHSYVLSNGMGFKPDSISTSGSRLAA